MSSSASRRRPASACCTACVSVPSNSCRLGRPVSGSLSDCVATSRRASTRAVCHDRAAQQEAQHRTAMRPRRATTRRPVRPTTRARRGPRRPATAGRPRQSPDAGRAPWPRRGSGRHRYGPRRSTRRSLPRSASNSAERQQATAQARQPGQQQRADVPGDARRPAARQRREHLQRDDGRTEAAEPHPASAAGGHGCASTQASAAMLAQTASSHTANSAQGSLPTAKPTG